MAINAVAMNHGATLAICRILTQLWEVGLPSELSPLATTALLFVVGTNSATLFDVSAPEIAFLRLLEK